MTKIHAHLSVPVKQLWHCDQCGKEDYWGDSWTWFGSYAMAENIPEDLPTICSADCLAIFKARMNAGDVIVPSVKLKGYNGVKIIGKRKGY